MNPLEEIIKIRVNNFNIKHFKKLGYDVKPNEYINIFVKELPIGSGTKINVQCNYCGEIFKKSYRRFLETMEDVCCGKCKKYKMMKHSLEKYGNVCSLRNDEIQLKSKNKNLKNLGVEYPFQNLEILKKAKETAIEKYGHAYQSSSISKQQRKLNDIFGGILNYSIFPYRVDMFFTEEKIYLEYDGSGHSLSIKLGRKTEDEFLKNEIKRRKILFEMGLKEFRIFSNDDKLPNKKELINIKNRAFYILEKENWYFYDLNTKTESFGK